ncbi:MAG: T9SS type A sorting domain-containing protein, partial [Candidatus Cloacimonetes bacterium]|nr:T9SS type A sorting domain-containing protein [Candidatus Cloacimonadota bacterium]
PAYENISKIIANTVPNGIGSLTDYAQAIKLNSEPIAGSGTTSELSYYTFEDNFEIVNNVTYYYWLESVDYTGDSYLYEPIHITTPENIDNPQAPEIDFGLSTDIQSIFPNPFNPSTAISYYLTEDSDVKIEIFNLKGQKVFEFDEGFKSAEQNHSVVWNGKNFRAETVASGIYLFKLIANDIVKTKKALLQK